MKQILACLSSALQSSSLLNRKYFHSTNRTGWIPPSEMDFFHFARQAYSPDIIHSLQKLNEEVLDQLNKKKLMPSEEDLHGEFKNFDKAPSRGLVREHFNHLRFFEYFFSKKTLNIFDIGCGSGDFTKLALFSGHDCLATETHFQKANINELSTYFDFLNYARFQRRRLFELREIELSIQPMQEINISATHFDVIYINQCIVHFPSVNKKNHFWTEEDWRFLLSDLTKYLHPDGIIFITLADPCYKKLPPLLEHFYIDYSIVFPGWEDAWWPLLIIKKKRLLNYLKKNSKTTPRAHDLEWSAIHRTEFMKESNNKLSVLLTS